MKGHDEALARLRTAVQTVSLRTASDAFLASLSMRDLVRRGVLPALVIARHLPEHAYRKQTRFSNGDECAVCGFSKHEEEYGISPGRLARDIEALKKARPVPTARDIEAFNAILRTVAEQQRCALDGRARRAELAKALGPAFKSNKYERMDLLDALGRCSVLAPAGEGFLRRFVPYEERTEGGGNNEFAYPFGSWEARLGFDREAVRELFPQEGIVLEASLAASSLNERAARAELETKSARARGGDEIAEVLFAPTGLWIARLKDGRHAIFYKLARRWRWVTGTRDDVLALVPETMFAEAVAAVMRGERSAATR